MICRLYTTRSVLGTEGKPSGGEVGHSAEADPEGLGAGWSFGGSVVVVALLRQELLEIRQHERFLGRGFFFTTRQTDIHSLSANTAVQGSLGQVRFRYVKNKIHQAMMFSNARQFLRR